MLRHKTLLFVLVVIAASGCSDKGYVRTSLDNQPGFRRTAHEVHASDRSRNKSNDIRRDLVEVQQYLAAGEFALARREAAVVLKKAPDSADARHRRVRNQRVHCGARGRRRR